MALGTHARALAELLTRAAGVVDKHGNVHAPAGSPVGGQFVKKALLEAFTLGGARLGQGKMTDAEFAARQERVDRAMAEAFNSHSTHITHTNGAGVWHPERDALHREIAASIYQEAVDRGVPAQGKAIIAGGLGGAGKTTVLRDHAGIDPNRYLTLNSDDVKEVLAKRGLIPEVPGHEDLSPMERSALIHAESGRVAGLVADMAYRDRRNIIWDTTMGDPDWTAGLIEQLRNDHGYTDIKSVFVDIPVEVSVQRALSRYRRGLDDFADGQGHGGRYVPLRIIRAQGLPNGSTINREGFEKVKALLDGWSLYDNAVDGRAPILVAEGRRDGERSRGPGPTGRWPTHR